VLGHEAWSRVGLSPIGDWRLALQQAFPALATAEGAEASRRPGVTG
jgi:dTDP-4-dehydrorhamnose reductase